MRGHEYVRDVVKALLVAQVPGRLAVIEDGLDDPVGDLDFILDDGLYRLKSFPVVVVRATDAQIVKRTGESEWLVGYDVEVIVACANATIGNTEGATRQRDRLLLAVREALYVGLSSLPDDVDFPPGAWPEKTGPSVETLNGEPLAVGTVAFQAQVTEVADRGLPTVVGVDVTLTVDDPLM